MSTGNAGNSEGRRAPGNRIITPRRFREFFESHPECEIHRGAFEHWQDIVEEADWRNFGDVRATFKDADLVGDLIIFNIGRNKYRVLAYVSFKPGIPAWVYLKFVGTHREYDKLKLD